MRIFAERSPDRRGFLDLDLVDHSGGNECGEFAHMLDMVDAYSQWIEPRDVRTKALTSALEKLRHTRLDLPFPLLRNHSDNGSEFINGQLYRRCTAEHLTFTRSQEGKKNDKPRVEQKNRSMVRRFIGCGRYDTQKQVDQLNGIYAVLRLYLKFFKPVMKLIEKQRIGSKIKHIYDEPKTLYQRLVECKKLSRIFKRQFGECEENHQRGAQARHFV